MKKLLFIAVIIIYTTKLYSQCANPDNIYSFTYNDQIYEVVKEYKTWIDAATCAVERGGHLVEINDQEEQAAIHDAIINGAGIASDYTQIANGGNIAHVWIGATDQKEEGIWLWDGNNNGEGIHFWTGEGANGNGDGEPVDDAYHNWGGKSSGEANEPDNWQGQHHAAIGLQDWPSGSGHLGKAGEWNDIIGSSELYFVIEGSTATGFNHNTDINKGTFIVYPNPTDGLIYVDSEYKLVEIFDTTGRLLKQISQKNEINLTSYPKNTYFLRISNNSQVETRKIILN